jgi:hypothetical protein
MTFYFMTIYSLDKEGLIQYFINFFQDLFIIEQLHIFQIETIRRSIKKYSYSAMLSENVKILIN